MVTKKKTAEPVPPATPSLKARRQELAHLFSTCLNAIIDALDGPPLHKGRQKWLASKSQQSQSACGKWISEGGIPDYPGLIDVADGLGCSLDELFGRTQFAGKRTSLPVRQSDQNIGNVSFENRLLQHLSLPEGTELIVVSTDSMAPDINIHDIAFVNTETQTLDPGRVYAFQVAENNRLTIHRVNLGFDSTISLLSRNTNYETVTMKPADIATRTKPSVKAKLILKGEVIWTLKRIAPF